MFGLIELWFYRSCSGPDTRNLRDLTLSNLSLEKYWYREKEKLERNKMITGSNDFYDISKFELGIEQKLPVKNGEKKKRK